VADASKKPDQPKITRVKAKDSSKPVKEKAAVIEATKSRRSPRGLLRPFAALIEYFKGAWYELRQVRWPNRRATWGMTGALLGFTAFFVTFILLIDIFFEYLFKLILR
jgi:preprotein translocase subunit SecE